MAKGEGLTGWAGSEVWIVVGWVRQLDWRGGEGNEEIKRLGCIGLHWEFDQGWHSGLSWAHTRSI